ncbi:MAG: glycosyltransferase [Pseudomonadota bacterium]
MSLIKAQNRPAEHSNAVVFSCDDGHLPFAAFAADRIHRTEPDGDFDIVICMPDISQVSETLRQGPVRFCQIDTSSLPEIPTSKAWISAAAYFRWLLPQALAGTYQTLFYLDTDTYLARPGLGRVFERLDRLVPLSAVIDFGALGTDEQIRTYKASAKIKNLGGDNGEYFNSGVLVIQPDAFLSIDGPKRFLDAALRNVAYLRQHRDQDQGAMNLAFANDIIPLSPLYNWRARAWLHPREVERYRPYVLHFAGSGKPWTRQDDPFIASFAPEYLDYLTRAFPGFAPKAALRSKAWREENPRHKLKALEHLRIWLYLRRYEKTLRQLQDKDLDTKYDRMDAAIRDAIIG